jgi:hypothetical protein
MRIEKCRVGRATWLDVQVLLAVQAALMHLKRPCCRENCRDLFVSKPRYPSCRCAAVVPCQPLARARRGIASFDNVMSLTVTAPCFELSRQGSHASCSAPGPT